MARLQWKAPEPSQIVGAVQGAMPAMIEPQLASLAAVAPAGDSWLHEIKFDGYRMLARIEGGRATIVSRNGKDWTRRFPEVAKLLPSLPVETAILDCEVCYVLPNGVTGFSEL